MLVKQAVAEFFKKYNIGCIFHLPGIHTLSLNESLIKSRINVLMGKHEANIAFTADGYARTSGKTGIVLITPGPGLGNIVSGSMEAYNDDIPLLFIHIDTDRKEIGKGILHELKHPESIFKYITKKTYYASQADKLLSILEDAYLATLQERKGPVLISIPYAFFENNIAYDTKLADKYLSGSFTKERAGVAGVPWAEELVKKLEGVKKPVIIGGKALMFEGAKQMLDSICKTGSIPFITTTGGKGIVSEDSTYAFGSVMQKGTVRDIIASSDIVIAVGTRLRNVDAKRRGVKIDRLVHIDIDDKWIGRNYRTEIGITGNMQNVLQTLYEMLKGKRFEWDLGLLKERYATELAELDKQSQGFRTINILRRVIPEDTIITCDLNYLSYWAEYYFPVYRQNTFIMPRGISPIFYSLPASIGAKIGRPDRPCLSLCGDGGILPAIGELATMKQYEVPVVVLLHNNNSYGILEDAMRSRYNLKGVMELKNPDFIKIAKAFDIKAKRVQSLEELKNVFLRDVSWDEPFLVEFVSPVLPPPWKI